MQTFVILAVICICFFVEGSSASWAKKGYAFHGGHNNCNDFLSFTNISWWYDWGTQPFYHGKTACGNMDKITSHFVPMVWGWNPHRKFSLSVTNHTQAVLGFNEPNNNQQSHISPEAAALHWLEIEKHAHGIPLVSPAPSGYTQAKAWLDQFFKACNSCRVDYVAAHIYSCNPSHTVTVLQELYHRYHRGIWLTEFSCPHQPDPHKQLQYMKAVLPKLEAAHFVHGYAWFSGRHTDSSFAHASSNLLQANSSQLTALGRFYNDFHSGSHGTGVIVG